MKIRSAIRKLFANSRAGIIHLVPLVLILALGVGAVFAYRAYQQNSDSVLGVSFFPKTSKEPQKQKKVKTYALRGVILVKKPKGEFRQYRGKYGRAKITLSGVAGQNLVHRPEIVNDPNYQCVPSDSECFVYDLPTKDSIGKFSFKLSPGTYRISGELTGDAKNCFKPLTVGESFEIKGKMRKNVYVEPTGNCEAGGGTG